MSVTKEEAKIFCRKCGTENKKGAKFCVGCGEKLGETRGIELKKSKKIDNETLLEIFIPMAIVLFCMIATVYTQLLPILYIQFLPQLEIDNRQRFDYEKEGWFCEEKEGKKGIIDIDGDEIIPCKYDDITYVSGSDLAICTIREGWVTDVYNGWGNLILKTNGIVRGGTKHYLRLYDQTELLDVSVDSIEDCYAGLKPSYIDFKGNYLIKDVEGIREVDGAIWVCDTKESNDENNGRYYFINTDGERISDIYGISMCYSDGNGVYQVKTQEGHIQYVTEDGEIVAEASSNERWNYYYGFENRKYKVGREYRGEIYYGIIGKLDDNTIMTLEPKYKSIEGIGGCYITKKDTEELYSIYDGRGKEILTGLERPVISHLEEYKNTLFYKDGILMKISMDMGSCNIEKSVEIKNMRSVYVKEKDGEIRYIVETDNEEIYIYDRNLNCLYSAYGYVNSRISDDDMDILIISKWSEEDGNKEMAFNIFNEEDILYVERTMQENCHNGLISYNDDGTHSVWYYDENSTGESNWREILRTKYSLRRRGDDIHEIYLENREVYIKVD